MRLLRKGKKDKKWGIWFKENGEKIADKGMPLMHAMTVTKDEEMPGNPEIVAYNIIQAEDIDEAMKIAKKSPHLSREETTIEVHEMWPM